MSPLILITGATGHLGFRTLVILLQHAYRARVTHRRPEQAESLKQAKSLQPHLASLEFAHVPDITAAGAYDDAINGVDGVLHIASPIHTGIGPEENDWRTLLYEPAEQGSLRMLTAALKESRVKRVVITSSVVVLEPKGDAKRAGLHDLRELPDSKTMESAPTAEIAYIYSKLVSHVTATNFVKENSAHFDLVLVLPGYIQGANELYTSPDQLSDSRKSGSNEGTMTTALGLVVGKARITAQVFLDDVAKAHVLALQPEVAKDGDNLLICGNGGNSLPWSEFVPIIQRLFPDAIRDGVLKPGAPDDDALTYFDVEASEAALGYKFSGPEEMIRSVVGQFLDLVKCG